MIAASQRSRVARRAILSAAICTLGVLALSATALAARAHRTSAYPAAATKPAFSVRASALEHARSASTKKKPKTPKLHGDPQRALLGFQAMQRYYYILGSGLYKGEPFSYLWPFSQALAATVSVDEIPALRTTMKRELKARIVGLRSYYDSDDSGAPEGTFASTLGAYDGEVAPPAGPGGTKYYDDNDWIGIELMRLYRLTREPSTLGLAEEVMAFEMAGWQSSPELGCPGGLPFSNSLKNSERNTITTAPAAELAMQLYHVTGNAAYLQFAEQAYEWVHTCLLEPTGLYGDHVNKRGVVEPRLWSYTQGVMIGAGTMLYQATGNPYYLEQAEQTASAAAAYFTPSRLGGETPFFPSVYFRNLLYFDAVTGVTGGRSTAQSYADYFWQHLRTASDVFVYGSPPTGQLLVQAAIVQIYALLSSSPDTYF